jgi:hypothetical protein
MRVLRMREKLKTWLIVAGCLLCTGVLVAVSVRGMGGSTEEQLDKMTHEERQFCLQSLWQITTNSTRSDVIRMLGSPSRDLGLKVNWWVKLGQERSRVGVFFTAAGYADEVVLDGGSGRFYYCRSVAEHTDSTSTSGQSSQAGAE